MTSGRFDGRYVVTGTQEPSWVAVSMSLKEKLHLRADEELRALKEASFNANLPARNETHLDERGSVKVLPKYLYSLADKIRLASEWGSSRLPTMLSIRLISTQSTPIPSMVAKRINLLKFKCN